jgi:glycosyltransferase 2 family protein
MSTIRSSFKRWLPGVVVAIALLGAVFIAMDWSEIQGVLKQASWIPIPYALLVTGVSYLCISYSFARVAQLLGISMRASDLTAVGFVSTVLNHLVSSGGAAGNSIRLVVMGRHGVSLREVVAVTLLHFYLTSLAMMGMLPVGLVYFLLHAVVGRTTAVILIAVSALILMASAVAAGMLFWGWMRMAVLQGLTRGAHRLLRRDVSESLERLDETLATATETIRRRPASILVIMVLIGTDWIFSAATLWFCFRSLGVTLLPGQLVSGFVIGTVAGVASMIPGGLGVQEGSMAGVFHLLGAALEPALLASVLYRVVYFMVPYAVSLAFYGQLLRAGRTSPEGVQ